MIFNLFLAQIALAQILAQSNEPVGKPKRADVRHSWPEPISRLG